MLFAYVILSNNIIPLCAAERNSIFLVRLTFDLKSCPPALQSPINVGISS